MYIIKSPKLYDLTELHHNNIVKNYVIIRLRLICSGKCTTLDDLSNRVCVPNETEDLNLHVVNMITGTNESLFMQKIFFLIL